MDVGESRDHQQGERHADHDEPATDPHQNRPPLRRRLGNMSE
jgi:hypothetical protein